MYKRMIAVVAVSLFAGCQDSGYRGASGPQSHLRKVETGDTGAAAQSSRQARGLSRIDHFAEAARPPEPASSQSRSRAVRRHPAIGPHSPEQIKRRVAQLVEPPRLAPVPKATPPEPPAERAYPPSRVRVIQNKDGSQGIVMEREEVVAEVETDGDEITIENGRVIGRRPAPAAGRGARRQTVAEPAAESREDARRRAEAEDADASAVEQHRPTQPAGRCVAEALDHLKRYSPSGHAVYVRIKDKAMFTTWILCDEMQRGLTTAVHETVHMLTDQLDAYPLINGGQLRRIRSFEGFAQPGRIASQFTNRDDYVKTYLLPGAASSAQSFTYLLDEFNAYTHDLNTAVQTLALAPKSTNLGHRDGLAAMMNFLMSYIAFAEKSEPQTWEGLQRPEVTKIVATLWSEAERTMEKSCKLPRYSVDDQAYLNHICEPANGRALSRLLGRAPRCPRACLSPSG